MWFDFAHHPESIEGRLCSLPRGISFPQKRYLSFTALFHGASPVKYQLDQDRVARPKCYSTGESHLFSDLRSLSRQARKDRKENSFDPLPWRPLCLCSLPRGISFPQKRYLSFTALFHGASPVEYRLDQDQVVRPKRYSTGESHPLSDPLLFSVLGALCVFARGPSLSDSLNSTKKFKYVWLRLGINDIDHLPQATEATPVKRHQKPMEMKRIRIVRLLRQRPCLPHILLGQDVPELLV